MWVSVTGSRTLGEGNSHPPQYSCPEDSMDRGGLVGYSPCDHNESDMTEHTFMSLART